MTPKTVSPQWASMFYCRIGQRDICPTNHWWNGLHRKCSVRSCLTLIVWSICLMIIFAVPDRAHSITRAEWDFLLVPGYCKINGEKRATASLARYTISLRAREDEQFYLVTETNYHHHGKVDGEGMSANYHALYDIFILHCGVGSRIRDRVSSTGGRLISHVVRRCSVNRRTVIS